jgi:predicted RND superfamily exporter protein
MFTVVGLLGMTGIIINDSIVLVTTIDEYAKDRGIVPSIIDGTADRLRPVLLTTLTTVLGLTPLLFEQSTQAQFIKPTVITLVYGLGFGMVLVLLVVPALIAMQHDIRRHTDALRHALKFRKSNVRVPMLLGAGAIVVWLGSTMGIAILKGDLPDALTAIWPALADLPVLPAALIAFVAGAAAVCLVIYLGLVATRFRRRQPAGQP